MSSGRLTRKDVATASLRNTALLDAEEASSSPPQSFRSISSGISTLFVARIDQSLAPSTSSKEPRVRARRSGHIKRWLEEQRRLTTDHAKPIVINNNPGAGTSCHPYLAYPHITWPKPVESLDDGASIADYVIVEEDKDMETEMFPMPQSRSTFLSRQESPRPPSSTRTKRSLRFPFSRRTAMPLNDDLNEIPRVSTIGIRHRDPIPFSFRPDDPSSYKQGHRLDSPDTKMYRSNPRNIQTNRVGIPAPTSFHHPNAIMPPRLSVETMSSGRTDNSSVPMHLNRIQSQTSNVLAPSIGGSAYSTPMSLGAQRRSIFSAKSFKSPSTTFSASQSSSSVTKHFHLDAIHGSLNQKSSILTKKSSQIFRDIAQLSSSITSSKRKKLVVSGIHRNDYRALSGLQKWCESFGEVRQMTWAPNGDIHVDFKRSDVADTVCRIRAQVIIPGVGSVALSWYTGKKP